MTKKLALLSSTLALTTGLVANQPNPEFQLPIKADAWQLFGFNQEIDLEKTFSGTPVKIVWAWDNRDENWVSYSPQYAMKMALEDANHTVVDRLHPNQGFWIQSYEDINVTVEEVFYPLYDMCVNVNSDLYWENATDENGVALTSPDMKCDNFVSTLSNFSIIESDLVVENETDVKGFFKTNMPIVFIKNLNTNLMVALDDIQDYNLTNYVEVNGTYMYDITFDSTFDNINNVELTDFTFTLGNTSSADYYMNMYLGNSDKVEDSIMLQIQFPTPQQQ